MHDILSIIELFLAILGGYYLLLKLLAAIIYRKLMAKVAEAKDSETNIKINDINSPKYTITDSCPICGSNNIEIFEQYIFSTNEEKNFEGYIIECLDCGLQSPVLDSMEHCIDYWNTRDRKKTYSWLPGDPDNISGEVQNGETD